MKLCIFSDIHGNLEALEKMLERERAVAEAFFFAGDIFGYFYGQIEIIQNLSSIPNLFAVRGNHDEHYLAGENKDCIIDKYGSSYDLPLSPKQRAFLSSMPSFMETTIAGKKFGMFHGGPDEPMTQRIYPDTELRPGVLQGRYDYLILGHTHYRFLKKAGSTWIVNPGSLGQPRDGKGFSYCMLDTDEDSFRFKTVDANMEKLLLQVQDRDGNRSVYEYLTNKYGAIS